LGVRGPVEVPWSRAEAPFAQGWIVERWQVGSTLHRSGLRTVQVEGAASITADQTRLRWHGGLPARRSLSLLQHLSLGRVAQQAWSAKQCGVSTTRPKTTHHNHLANPQIAG